MKTFFKLAVILVLSATFFGTNATAKEPGVELADFAKKLGDSAPELALSEWIKGDPVKAGDGSTLVIEFWETTCPYCLESLPLLSELAKFYEKDKIRFIAISNESADTLKAFISENPDTTAFRIARDSENATKAAFFKAFGIEGLPHSFIVNAKGEVIWEGHPMSGLGTAVDEIANGDFDFEFHKNMNAARDLVRPYFRLITKSDETELIQLIGEKILNYAKDDPDFLNRFAWGIVSDKDVRLRDLSLAYKMAKRAMDIAGDDSPQVVDTYGKVLVQLGKKEEGEQYIKKAAEMKEAEK